MTKQSQRAPKKKLTLDSVVADWEKNNERLEAEAKPAVERLLGERFPGVSKQDAYPYVDDQYVPCGATDNDRRSKFQVSFKPEVFEVAAGEKVVHAEMPDGLSYIDLNYYPLPEDTVQDLVRQISEDLEGIRRKGAPDARAAFLEAAKGLVSVNKAFANGEIRPVPHGDLREEQLSKALVALAETCGVRLQAPLRIDANGEVSLVALKEGAVDGKMGCAQFGARFADLLSGMNFRTGIVPLSRVSPETGWGKLNHFAAEKIVLQQFEAMGPVADVAAAQPAGLRKAIAAEKARLEHVEPTPLEKLIEGGLTFSQVVEAFAKRRSPEEVAYAQAARKNHHKEGDLEVDESAIVSKGDDDGAYVMGWVWVPKAETEEEV